MRSLIVYESLYGNTHTIAASIGGVLTTFGDVTEVPVQFATDELFDKADLVLVGGPTHPQAAKASHGPQESLELDRGAVGPALRAWFASVPDGHGKAAAAFDTRSVAAPVEAGSACTGIAQRLRRHGFVVLAEPESFVLDRHNQLLSGEGERAGQWAGGLVGAFTSAR